MNVFVTNLLDTTPEIDDRTSGIGTYNYDFVHPKYDKVLRF